MKEKNVCMWSKGCYNNNFTVSIVYASAISLSLLTALLTVAAAVVL